MNIAFADSLKKKGAHFHALIRKELRGFWENAAVVRQSGIRNVRPVSSFIPGALALPCDDFFSHRSKKLRPLLGALMLGALGNRYGRAVEKCLIFPEILHSASLIVDDIEDSATLRRGKPCLHVRYGIDTAVNLANGLYFFPFYSLNHSKFPATLRSNISNILTESMNRIHLGQGLDIFWHRNNRLLITPKQYELMARLKTSSFFRAEAQLAALFSRTDSNTAKKAAAFAENIGVAFQIIDDVLDLTPDKDHKFGKRFAQDIVEGKKTLIVALALQRAPKKERKELIGILGLHSTSRSLAKKAIRIFHEFDCIGDARTYAEQLVRKSWWDLSEGLKPSRQKDLLRHYCEFLVQRRF